MFSIPRMRLPLLLVLIVTGIPRCCMRLEGQTTINVSEFEYSYVVNELDQGGKLTSTTYRRTEYFASDGLERVEVVDASGVERPVQILNPLDNTVTTIDAKRKTFTVKHEQVAPTVSVERNPKPANVNTLLGEKPIAGLSCVGYSGTVDATYYEMWECNERDFGAFIQRAKDGTGHEEYLKRFTPDVQVPSDFFSPPSGYTEMSGPVNPIPGAPIQ